MCHDFKISQFMLFSFVLIVVKGCQMLEVKGSRPRPNVKAEAKNFGLEPQVKIFASRHNTLQRLLLFLTYLLCVLCNQVDR